MNRRETELWTMKFKPVLPWPVPEYELVDPDPAESPAQLIALLQMYISGHHGHRSAERSLKAMIREYQFSPGEPHLHTILAKIPDTPWETQHGLLREIWWESMQPNACVEILEKWTTFRRPKCPACGRSGGFAPTEYNAIGVKPYAVRVCPECAAREVGQSLSTLLKELRKNGGITGSELLSVDNWLEYPSEDLEEALGPEGIGKLQSLSSELRMCWPDIGKMTSIARQAIRNTVKFKPGPFYTPASIPTRYWLYMSGWTCARCGADIPKKVSDPLTSHFPMEQASCVCNACFKENKCAECGKPALSQLGLCWDHFLHSCKSLCIRRGLSRAELQVASAMFGFSRVTFPRTGPPQEPGQGKKPKPQVKECKACGFSFEGPARRECCATCYARLRRAENMNDLGTLREFKALNVEVRPGLQRGEQ